MAEDDCTNEEIDVAIRARIEALGDGRLVKQLLAAGQIVVYLGGEDMVRVHADGTREVIGRVPAAGEEGERS